MTNEELYELMSRFDKSGLTFLKVTQKDCTVELGKSAPVLPMPIPAAAGAGGAAPAPAPVAEEKPAMPCVTAPLVGTFYVASAPGAQPYVRPGQKVKKGDTLCLIEAMKTMNELKAPCDCTIEEILVEDGTLVSFDQGLMTYREG